MGSQFRKTRYVPELNIPNPFNMQEKVWDSLIGEERNEKIAWRRVAILSMFCFVLSLITLIYTANLPKTVPMIVTVAPWGEAKYIGDVSGHSYGNIRIPDVAIQYQLRDFIMKLRSISRDSEVLYQNITDCYEKVTNNAASIMTVEVRKEDPFSLVGKTRRTVSIESILRISTETWQVDWIETTTGTPNKIERMRGLFTVKILEPTEKQRIKNPLGIYIDDYDMTNITGAIE